MLNDCIYLKNFVVYEATVMNYKTCAGIFDKPIEEGPIQDYANGRISILPEVARTFKRQGHLDTKMLLHLGLWRASKYPS